MNADEFEKRLQRQPIGRIPEEWRKEILQNASATSAHSSFVIRHSILSRLSTLLWPHPKAWAGLAALWIAIAAGQFAASDHPVHHAKKPAPPSSDEMLVLRQQTRLMAELVGQSPAVDVDRPKSATPQPRSDRRTETPLA